MLQGFTPAEIKFLLSLSCIQIFPNPASFANPPIPEDDSSSFLRKPRPNICQIFVDHKNIKDFCKCCMVSAHESPLAQGAVHTLGSTGRSRRKQGCGVYFCAESSSLVK